MASAATSLPAPAHQAAKSALNAALAESNIVDKDGAQNGDDGEPGEIQEVDMQAQAENIRTVFNDPKNFNVKVGYVPSPLSARLHLAVLYANALTSPLLHSIPSTHPGHFGLIPPRRRVATFRRPPRQPFLRPHSRKHLVLPRLSDGWRTSSV